MKATSLVGRRTFVSSLSGTGVLLATGSNVADAEPTQLERRNRWTLPEKNQIRRKFDETRSRRVVFVSHCMLNQNARITTAADFAANNGHHQVSKMIEDHAKTMETKNQ